MQPYRFTPSERTAATVEAFLDACHLEPTIAAEHLQFGYFEPWLRNIGRPDLAEIAAQVRQGSLDRSHGLCEFLETAAPAPPFDPAGWPSATLALDFVRPSYEVAARRYEALENRGRAVLTFASTVAVAAPTFAVAVQGRNAPQFASVLFVLAVAAFAGVVVCAVLMARVGWLRFIDPQVLYDSYLDCTETEFRLSILYFAGAHFASNRRVLLRLGRITDVMSLLLFSEAAALAAWMVWARSEPPIPWI